MGTAGSKNYTYERHVQALCCTAQTLRRFAFMIEFPAHHVTHTSLCVASVQLIRSIALAIGNHCGARGALWRARVHPFHAEKLPEKIQRYFQHFVVYVLDWGDVDF